MNYPYINPLAPLYLVVVSVVFVTIAVVLHCYKDKRIKVSKIACFAVLLAFLVVKIAVAYKTQSHSDMPNFFLPWSYNLANGNFANFYLSDVATGEIQRLNDYPPMLMYVLFAIGKIVNMFEISQVGWMFLMRIPAIVCDIVASYYILKLAIIFEKSREVKSEGFQSRKTRRQKAENCEKLQTSEIKTAKEIAKESVNLKNFPKEVSIFAFSCMLIYLLNPAMITDSSWWGQVDGVIAMFFVLTIYNVYLKRDTAVVVTAILALCFKLQYIFFMPALGMYYIVRLIKEGKVLFVKLLKGVAIGACLFFAINLPLCLSPMMNGHPLFMFQIYVNQVSNYSYYTLNAPNLFGALNLNFVPLEGNGGVWSVIVVMGVSIFVAILSFFGDGKKKIATLGAFTIITVFMFSFKMHERYMIYSLILFLIVYMQSGKIGDLIAYCGFTVVQFLTIGSIMCIKGITFDFSDKRLQIISIICLTLYIGYVILISQAEITARVHKTNRFEKH